MNESWRILRERLSEDWPARRTELDRIYELHRRWWPSVYKPGGIILPPSWDSPPDCPVVEVDSDTFPRLPWWRRFF